jgi:hypothetical protein
MGPLHRCTRFALRESAGSAPARATEQSIIDQSITDQSITDRSIIDQFVTDQSVTDQYVTDQAMPARMAGSSAEAKPAPVASAQAAFSHIAVSKALLIIGMFMPKLGLTPFLDTALGAGFSATGATSTRSQAAASLRATAKE